MIRKNSKTGSQLKITLVKSMIGRKKNHIQIAQQLGLRKLHQFVLVDNIPSVKGMIDKINYVLKIEDVQ
jgi:large subunit ribosomal protein L30